MPRIFTQTNNFAGDVDVDGTVSATSYTGDGSGLTGIASGTGGVTNTGSTTIGADTDADGVGEIALQTGGTTRVTVENAGPVRLDGVDLKFRSGVNDLTVTASPTAARTITLPDSTGTVFLTGATDLAITDGGTGASTATAARTNLGLGSIATQDAASVSITGGSISGITDLAVADGGTGASTASAARTNLGVAIGTDVQAYSARLDELAALAVTDGNFAVASGTGWVAESGATARASLGLGSIATQSAASVSITGGSISGITDLAIADGGTGASTASAARTNLGIDAIATKKSNLAATAAPGATDDSAAGYAVGSRWIDTTNDKEYVCLDATASAAVWTETTSTGGGASTNPTSGYLPYNSSATFADSPLFTDGTNVGVGSSDLEAWSSSYVGIEIGGATSIRGANSSPITVYGSNTYYDTASKYKTTAAAARYVQNTGVHQWDVAPSGTADTAITWTTAFKIDNDTTAGNTKLLLYDVSAGTVKRVSIGAADSGGTGYKVLRVPN